MFCLKCGEGIPDGSAACPKCGVNLKERDSEKVAVYASQKEMHENDTPIVGIVSKKSLYIWCFFAIVSLLFLALNYFKVSVSLYSAGSSDTSYSGYGLLGCLKGSVSISGYMVVFLIITNIAVLITGIIGARGNILKASVLKIIMAMESIAYLTVTIVPYFNIRKVLEEFDSDLSNTNIGIGCYLNMALAVVVAIYFFVNINKQLKDK